MCEENGWDYPCYVARGRYDDGAYLSVEPSAAYDGLKAGYFVVIAASGYPGKVRGGDPVSGLADASGEGVKVFHAGTREENGAIVSAGGRVLTVCALGDDLGVARDRAYDAARRIRLDGSFYRRDIGHRALGK